GEVEQINGLCAAIGFGGLKTGLAGRDDGEHALAVVQWLKARLDGSHDQIIRLPEFVGNAVDMELVDASEAPEFLIGGKFDAEKGMAVEHAEAVAVAVDGQSALVRDLLDAGEADRIDTDHDGGAAGALYEIVIAKHRVDFVGDVEGVHHLFAGALR